MWSWGLCRRSNCYHLDNIIKFAMTVSVHNLSNSLFTNRPNIQRYIFRAIETIVKQTANKYIYKHRIVRDASMFIPVSLTSSACAAVPWFNYLFCLNLSVLSTSPRKEGNQAYGIAMLSGCLWAIRNCYDFQLALGSTQPLTEMSTRILPVGKGRPAREADDLAAICESIV
jgi:hypothetical protein